MINCAKTIATMKLAPMLISAGLLPLTAAASQAAKPNILIIVTDDMGYSDLGCFGSEIDTPNIDRLADEGVRFTRFYSNPMSAPTRASLLTGLYQTNAGIGNMGMETNVREYQNFLRDDCATVAETFSRAGYATCQSGKWHVGSGEGQKPLDRGFDTAFTMIGGATDYYQPQGMYVGNQEWQAGEGFYMTHAITDHAVRFIEEQREAPFMMYVAYNAPHWPLQAPQKDIDKYKGRYDRGWDVIRQERFERMKSLGVLTPDAVLSEPDERAAKWQWDSLSAKQRKEWANKMEIYAAMIDIVDQGVGQMTEALRRQGVLDNTIVIFLSDNGACPESRAKRYIDGVPDDAPPTVAGSTIVYKAPWANVSSTPHLRYKKSTFNGGINVPLIVRWPETAGRSGFNRSAAHVIDILPTLIEITGVQKIENMDGRTMQNFDGVSMAPLLRGEDKQLHDYICWEHRGECAIVKGDWKMTFFHPEGRWSLYDLTQNGGVEIEDISAVHPEKVAELMNDYRQWMADNGVLPYEQQLQLPLR